MHRWALTTGAHSWLVGAGVGANAFRSRTASEENENALSLRAQSELSGPAPAGRYYALVQLSTFRNQVFAMSAIRRRELSAVNETGYTTPRLRCAMRSIQKALAASRA
jgi:hypothetical protein